MHSPPLYSIQALEFKYKLGKLWVHALKGLSLEIAAGKLIGLAGPSGSGKSTLLNLLGLIEAPQSGSLSMLDRPLDSLTENEKNEIRRTQLGFVFQQFLLFETLTAIENVSYFLKSRQLSKADIRKRASDSLEMVGLADQLGKRPLELSGGQRQRVAIARAIAKQPAVILADEPTASLDQGTGATVMGIFSRLVNDQSKSVVLASHDPMALSYCDEVIYLKDGVIDRVESKSRGGSQ